MIPPSSIVAAVDFSETSRLALVLAARLAQRCGATLTVFHTEDPLLSAAARAEGIALAVSPAATWPSVSRSSLRR